MVLTPGVTTYAMWSVVEGLFHDNKPSRALTLEANFHNTVQGDMSVLVYSQRLKSLADALSDVGQVVSPDTLVITLLHGRSLGMCTNIGRSLITPTGGKATTPSSGSSVGGSSSGNSSWRHKNNKFKGKSPGSSSNSANNTNVLFGRSFPCYNPWTDTFQLWLVPVGATQTPTGGLGTFGHAPLQALLA
ncbi:uncharacterized protein LOC133918051 [Phragmites australis]|uniref:uncharacterized protein LOC133918051 n=1 Tax=Phragmites australis TaxID=29695 RepID=UPI002D78829E|nr:uncharacterized protein LOC133918051 [Phragmites australis]